MEKEHMKNAKQREGVNYTTVKKRESQTDHHQSALIDHAAVCNHTIDWEGVKLPAKDMDWTKRGIREAICIRKGFILSIVMSGTTISQMCIPSCCRLPLPHLVVAVRSTEDDV